MDMEIDGGQEAEFSQATQTFLDWFKSLPGSTFHDDIKIEDFRGKNAGRGIVATKDIEPDTILFTIPRQSIICPATSSFPSLLPQVFAQPTDDDAQSITSSDDTTLPPKQDPWTTLILILIYEHFRPLSGTSSKWHPYLSLLPTTFDTPMFWTPSEIAHLQASSLRQKIGKPTADDMIRSRIVSVIREHQSVFFPPSVVPADALPSDEELFHLAHRMGSAIMAYAFDLEKEGEDDEEEQGEDEWVEDRETQQTMGMVPMADMLNADAEFNAFINHGEECLTAVAIRKIAAGEEILNYYGPLASSELLRRYGYVTEKHARYDVVELPWGLVEKGLKGRFSGVVGAKEWELVDKRVAENDEFEMEEAFVLERVSEEPDSTGRVNGEAVFSALPEELDEQVKVWLKAVRKVNPTVGEALSDKDARNEIYLDSVLRALKEREAEYATSLEEDERIFGSGCGGEGRRVQMAVWVRMGEKKVLREAQAWVSGKLEELRGKMSSASKTRGAEDDGRSAKRQRN